MERKTFEMVVESVVEDRSGVYVHMALPWRIPQPPADTVKYHAAHASREPWMARGRSVVVAIDTSAAALEAERARVLALKVEEDEAVMRRFAERDATRRAAEAAALG